MAQGSRFTRFLVFLLGFLVLPTAVWVFVSPGSAQADDLIIDDNGAVSLVITGNSVLALTTTVAPAAPIGKTSSPPSPPPSEKQEKVVPLTPPNSDSQVKIDPHQTPDKKIKITIEVSPHKSARSVPTAPSALHPTVEKTVDNVVLRGVDKKPVLTITPDQRRSDAVVIQQQSVNASTRLPLQIDTKSHIISVQTTTGVQPVTVLPNQAVVGAQRQVSGAFLPTTTTGVTLSQEGNQAVYTVVQQKSGKLLGTFPLLFPSSVKISAQTGRTVSVQQSPFLHYFWYLVK